MSNFLLEPGELKKRIQLQKTIPNLILTASSQPEEWSDIEIVTLTQHAKDIATNRAWSHSVAFPGNVDDLINKLMDEEYPLHEFIEVLPNKILVGIDCDVVDDAAVDRAMLMLIEMDTFEPGTIKFFNEAE